MVTELISAIERCPPGDLEEAQQRLQERKEALPETAPRSVGQIYDGAIYTLREKETGREYGSLDAISTALSGIARLEERDPEVLADYLA